MTATTPRRVLFTGDIHGNTAWWHQHVFKMARRYRCDLIFQVGDFGIWPGSGGRRFLDSLDAAAVRLGIPIWFIDGNHEDFDQLYAIPVDDDGLHRVRPRITHVPRGHRWSWGGRWFLARGGATSIDVAYRIPGLSWWPQEAITTIDVDRCIVGGPTDVMIAHDTPLDVTFGTSAPSDAGLPITVRNAAHGNRSALQHIVDAVRPSLYVHGHWHLSDDRAYLRSVDGELMRVVSLQADGGAAPGGRGHCAVMEID